MKRAEILEDARKCVCGDREEDYGTPENNFKTIADFWTAYIQATHKLGDTISIDAKDVAAMMALLKIARIARGNKADSFIDLAGYAACAGEIATREKKREGIPAC